MSGMLQLLLMLLALGDVLYRTDHTEWPIVSVIQDFGPAFEPAHAVFVMDTIFDYVR